MGRKPKNQELLDMVQKNLELAKKENEVEILSVGEAEAMSIAKAVEEKQILSNRRQQVMLKLDGRRLEQSVKIMDAMDIALDKIINQFSFDEDGEPITMTAMDFKFYTDAYKNLSNSLREVSRLDSVDTGGKAGRISLEIKFEN